MEFHRFAFDDDRPGDEMYDTEEIHREEEVDIDKMSLETLSGTVEEGNVKAAAKVEALKQCHFEFDQENTYDAALA